ncbi:neuronal pentraxin-1, partial [Nematostella vectensis]|uniref:neuronal pentraxin-1 n=1 Tax=Nematostella vectensis TaxID=45351 RepID=UPI0020770131
GACEVECFVEPDCLSYNYRSLSNTCELSSSSHRRQPENLTSCDNENCTYRAIEDACAGVVCPNENCKCQSGFDERGYRCVCKACFNRPDCNQALHELQFRREIHADAVHFKPLSFMNFTVAFWAQSVGIGTWQSVVSIAYGNIYNAVFFLLGSDGIKLSVQGLILGFHTASCEVLDGKWHHFALTYSTARHNNLKLFVDGAEVWKIKPDAEKISSYRVTDSYLVLGQDQDSYGVGFVNNQRFIGNLTSVNIWDSDMRGSIPAFAKQCVSEDGNVFSWKNAHKGIQGDIKVVCPTDCEAP